MFKTIATAALAVSFAGAAMAEEKKSASFLTASTEAQIGYIDTSVSMAGGMLSRSQSQCIADWSKGQHAAGYKEVIDTIKKFENYHPQGVIIAMLEKSCGRFELAQR